jgi:ATP-dependent DNA helicase RecG
MVEAAEAKVFPAPQFREDCNRVSVVLGRPKPFAEMDRNERMLACYQHAGLR